MDALERRLQALEMIMAERLALEPMPVLTHLEDTLRERAQRPGGGEVEEAALAVLSRARGGFDPYSAGYGIQSPDELPQAS